MTKLDEHSPGVLIVSPKNPPRSRLRLDSDAD